MKFKATGQNNETGARMVLEIDAESKGAAERKATQAGMYVTKIESAGGEGVDYETMSSSARPGMGRKLLIRLILLVIVLAALWFLWPRFRALIDQ